MPKTITLPDDLADSLLRHAEHSAHDALERGNDRGARLWGDLAEALKHPAAPRSRKTIDFPLIIEAVDDGDDGVGLSPQRAVAHGIDTRALRDWIEAVIVAKIEQSPGFFDEIPGIAAGIAVGFCAGVVSAREADR